MSTQELIKLVQDAAEREANGDASAHHELVNAVQKLQRAVTTPVEKMIRLRFQCIMNVCIRICQEWGILQALAARKISTTTAELSQETNVDELMITRILRLVVHAGLVDEVGPSTYMANPATSFATTKGMLGADKYYYDIMFKLCSNVGPLARENKLYQFPDESAGQKDPFEYTFGAQQFPWMGMPENREYGLAFEDFMTGRRAATWNKWFITYPAKEKLMSKPLKTDPDAVLLVDVAGGQGYWTQQFRDHIGDSLPGKFIVQDQPFVIEKAQLKGVEAMPHNFFEPQPIRGARVYYFKQIMHDWPDKTCQTILNHTVDAMETDYSTLLIDDFVLPEQGVGLIQAGLDIALMLQSSGIERTEKQWRILLDSVGLRIIKFWMQDNVPDGSEAVIECAKV